MLWHNTFTCRHGASPNNSIKIIYCTLIHKYSLLTIPDQELNQSESVLRARAIVAFHLGNFRQALFVLQVFSYSLKEFENSLFSAP
jgi:hypothetical protein